VVMAATSRKSAAPRRALPPLPRVADAFDRLVREKALQTLIRGALPARTLQRLLRNAMPRDKAREMPPEIWASLAAGIAYQSPEFGMVAAEALHERLAWDREPASLDDWWQRVADRPLEALWMAALSENRAVRKEFAHIAQHALENFRSSPACAPPSWDFVEGILDVQAETARALRDVEKALEDAERRDDSDREKLEELREEAKRLRRENGDLRAAKAAAERRAASSQSNGSAASEEARRIEDLERRLRKAEKEREHLTREIERLRPDEGPDQPASDESALRPGAAVQVPALPRYGASEDPLPRRRVLRQMLKKLFKKGKIGASHTHEDNVYKGVADHEKGIAKEAIDLLYREGLLVAKPTATDPHVSLSPDRTAELQAIIAGELQNPRLRRWAESE
jgi:hypothetical protein